MSWRITHRSGQRVLSGTEKNMLSKKSSHNGRIGDFHQVHHRKTGGQDDIATVLESKQSMVANSKCTSIEAQNRSAATGIYCRD